MAITKNRIVQPCPAIVPLVFDGEDLTVTYNVSACTPELLDTVGRTPARVILSQLLVSWEVLDEGRPYQPEAEADPVWAERALERRQAERAAAYDRLPASARAYSPPLNDSPPSAAERRAAYVAAWEAILRQLPQDFLGMVLGAILDDLFAGKSRRGASGAS